MLETAGNFDAFIVVQTGTIYQEDTTCVDGNPLMLYSYRRRTQRTQSVVAQHHHAGRLGAQSARPTAGL